MEIGFLDLDILMALHLSGKEVATVGEYWTLKVALVLLSLFSLT